MASGTPETGGWRPPWSPVDRRPNAPMRFHRPARATGRRFALLATVLLGTAVVVVFAPTAYAATNPTQYVNPFIGTDDSNAPNPVPGGAGGSTYPGAVVPFGMVQFSPDTPSGEPSGYKYSDTRRLPVTGYQLDQLRLRVHQGQRVGRARLLQDPAGPALDDGRVDRDQADRHGQADVSELDEFPAADQHESQRNRRP